MPEVVPEEPELPVPLPLDQKVDGEVDVVSAGVADGSLGLVLAGPDECGQHLHGST